MAIYWRESLDGEIGKMDDTRHDCHKSWSALLSDQPGCSFVKVDECGRVSELSAFLQFCWRQSLSKYNYISIHTYIVVCVRLPCYFLFSFKDEQCCAYFIRGTWKCVSLGDCTLISITCMCVRYWGHIKWLTVIATRTKARWKALAAGSTPLPAVCQHVRTI